MRNQYRELTVDSQYYMVSLEAPNLNQPTGTATGPVMTQVKKFISKAREEPTDNITPNRGEPKEWILAGVVSASHRRPGSLSTVGGQTVAMSNKNTLATSTTHGASRKSNRDVHNNDVEEAIAMQKMYNTILSARKVSEELRGQRVKTLQYKVLTDNQGQLSNIHQIKSIVDDLRPHLYIPESRQSTKQGKTVQEAKQAHPLLNIVDALIRTAKTGARLLRLVQTGQYDLLRRFFVRDPTMSSIEAWNESLRVEQWEERSQDEGDKVDTDNQIVAMNLESNPGANIAEQNLGRC